MLLSTKHILLVSSVVLLIGTLSLLGWVMVGEIVLIFTLTAVLAIVMLFQLENYLRLQRYLLKQGDDYKQIEALFSIFSILKFEYPLPSMRGFAASPDFLKILISLIYSQKPKLIIEAGTGLSTIIVATCLKHLGDGKVISLESKENYAQLSIETLEKHNLQDIAHVIYAPLKAISIEDKSWLWYDTQAIAAYEGIDLLIIDGPFNENQEPLIRYPALPILFQALNAHAVVVLDDADRDGEQEIVRQWMKEFNLKREKIRTEKGTVILRKK